MTNTTITAQQILDAIKPHLAAEREIAARIQRAIGADRLWKLPEDETAPVEDLPRNWEVNGTWEMPEFAEARRLTAAAGCVWDFEGWDRAADAVRFHLSLGGVKFLDAPDPAVSELKERDEMREAARQAVIDSVAEAATKDHDE